MRIIILSIISLFLCVSGIKAQTENEQISQLVDSLDYYNKIGNGEKVLKYVDLLRNDKHVNGLFVMEANGYAYLKQYAKAISILNDSIESMKDPQLGYSALGAIYELQNNNDILANKYNAGFNELAEYYRFINEYLESGIEGISFTMTESFREGFETFLRESVDANGVHFIKVSMRSSGEFPVNTICERYFNGGGHKNAAGGEFRGSLQECVDVFMSILDENDKFLN